MSVLKKNIISNTLLSLSQILFPLVTFPYISRILGPSGIGKVSFIDSLTQYFILFSAIGIPLYGVRELAKVRDDNEKSSKLFTELILLHLLTTTLFLSIYFGTVFLLIDKQNYFILSIIGGGILLSNVFIIEWYFQSQSKFDYITKRTISLRLIFIVLMFVLIKKDTDLTKYYLLFLILQVMNAGINFYFVFKSDIKIVFKNLDLKKHIKPLLFLTACSVIGSVYVLLDNVILGLLSTTLSVGYYSAAIKIVKVPISLINALSIVLVPKLSESFANNDLKSIKHYVDSSIHYILTFGMPLCIGMALTAKWTVFIISGPAFQPAIELIWFLCPIVILIALNCIYFFQVFTPGNKEITMLIILVVSALVSILLNILLIPKIQHLGAAITTTITELVVFVLSVFFSKRIFDINFNFKYFIVPIISSLIFIPIIYSVNLLNVNYIIKFIGGGTACMLAYYLIQRFIFKNTIVLRMEGFLKEMILFN
jgi:O-antigen/teichoic acid export membrane protein